MPAAKNRSCVEGLLNDLVYRRSFPPDIPLRILGNVQFYNNRIVPARDLPKRTMTLLNLGMQVGTR